MQIGRLQIRLTLGGTSVRDADVELARPTAAPRLLIRRTAQETPALVGRLFSICSVAQTCASLTAIESAMGHEPSQATQAMRGVLVAAEAVEQNALRACVDWPGLTGGRADIEGYRAIREATHRLASAVTADHDWKTPMRPLPRVDLAEPLADLRRRLETVLGPSLMDDLKTATFDGTNPQTSLAQTLANVAAGPQAKIGQTKIAPLRRSDIIRLRQRLVDPDQGDAFAAHPELMGRPAETGPFAWRHDHPALKAVLAKAGPGLLARLSARVIDLGEAASEIAALASPENRPQPTAPRTEAGTGLSVVACARGLLTHWLALEDGHVAAYRIVAPTEWNFHPQGVVWQGLLTLDGATETDIVNQASLWVTAIDPCLTYHVEAAHA